MRHSIRSQIFTGNYHDLLVVGTEGDEGQSADEVLGIHDAKLAKMGTDNLTRGAIDSYRKRHFGTADPLVPGRAKPRPIPSEPAATKPEQVAKAPLPQKVPSAADQAAAAVAMCIKPPVAAPHPTLSAPPEKFGICAECGEAVPSNQTKLSNLFVSKTLCKKCMEEARK